jgi:hypothetical protein
MRSRTVVVLVCCCAATACGPGHPKPPGGDPHLARALDGDIRGRCRVLGPVPDIMIGTKDPFTVLLRQDGAWLWAGTSPGGSLAVPLTKIAAGSHADVLVVSGTASTADRIDEKDDAALDRLIGGQLATAPAITVATGPDQPTLELPHNWCLKGDDCTSPQCPPK